MPRLGLLSGLVVGLCFGSPALGAEPNGAPTAAERTAEAKRHFKAGVAAADSGDWGKAHEEFSSAWGVKPHYKIAWALGGAEIELGKYRDATAHLEACLRDGKEMTKAERGQVEAMLEETRAKLVTLRIRSSVPGAEILVDGRSVGTSPLDGDVIVDPGRRSIVATKPGVKFVPVTLALSPGEAVDVPLSIVQAPPPVPPAPTVVEKPEEGGGWKPWALAGGATLTAVGIGVGIGMTVHANSLSRQADEQWQSMIGGMQAANQPGPVCGAGAPSGRQHACAAVMDKRQAQDRAETAAKAGFVVGGVAAIGTLVVALWPTEKKSAVQKSGLWVAPVVGQENGVHVGGAF